MIRTDLIPPPRIVNEEQSKEQSKTIIDQSVSSLDSEDELILPPISLMKRRLHKHPILKQKLKNIRLDLEEKKFISDIQIDDILNFVKNNDELSFTEIVVWVCTEVERFYLKPKSGAVKKDICVRLLLPLFDNNRKVCCEFIENCIPLVLQINTCGRMALRTYRYIFTKF